MSFISSVIFFSLFINSLQEEKELLRAGFSFFFSLSFFSFLAMGEALCIHYALLSKNQYNRDTQMLITSSYAILMLPIIVFSAHNRQWIICAE